MGKSANTEQMLPKVPHEPAGELLKTLGTRVRDARARHGMTRRMLARDSRISERYLAELEGGRGNLSILLLKRLAAAIDVPLTELVDEGPRPSAEYLLLTQRLRRLTSEDPAQAAAMIAERFGRSPKRSDRIALIGLRGAGKTTLGQLLAAKLGWEFVELSGAIEREAGVPLAEIFEFGGQAAYRRYELRALERILNASRRIVLAAGGGLVAETAALERLLDACYTVWLRALPREHWDRVLDQGDYRVRIGTRDREALADLQRILAQRESLYGMADAQLNTSAKTVAEALEELVELAARREAER
jgi:XRE family transcriptional regulator, aerobic/anaerobic benzoate catabolism transcriptional regulator